MKQKNIIVLFPLILMVVLVFNNACDIPPNNGNESPTTEPTEQPTPEITSTPTPTPTPVPGPTAWQEVGIQPVSAGQANYSYIGVKSDGAAYVAYRNKDIASGTPDVMVRKYDGSSWSGVPDNNGIYDIGSNTNDLQFTVGDDDELYMPVNVWLGDQEVYRYNGTSWPAMGNYGGSLWNYVDFAFENTGSDYIPYLTYNDVNGREIYIKKWDSGQSEWLSFNSNTSSWVISPFVDEHIATTIETAEVTRLEISGTTLYCVYGWTTLGTGETNGIAMKTMDISNTDGYSTEIPIATDIDLSAYMDTAICSNGDLYISYINLSDNIIVKKYSNSILSDTSFPTDITVLSPTPTTVADLSGNIYVMAKEFTVGVKIYKFDGTSWGLFSEPTNASRVTNVQLAIDRINNKLYLAYVAQDSYPVDEALRGKLCVCSMDL